MVDLRVALNCMDVMKRDGTYRGQKIGLIKLGIPKNIGYREGQLVLFTEELAPSNSELCMGEYARVKQKPTGRIRVESPLTQKDIDRQKAEGSLITTVGGVVGFPRCYVEEVLM